MESKLIVDVQPDSVNIALLEDGRLMELNRESRSENFTVGNIYLAKVKKLLPGLNASFVDVGYKREGFLHFIDLGSNFNAVAAATQIAVTNRRRPLMMNRLKGRPEVAKDAVISDLLKPGMEILVQVAKEPISTKGPRLTAEISLAGRFVVLIPFTNKISVSHKIKAGSERNRLRKIVQKKLPSNYGAIVRTVAQSRTAEEIENELDVLVKRWQSALVKLQKAKDTPTLILEEISRAEALLRDHLNPDYESIIINEKESYEEIKSYISLIEPAKSSIVKLYRDDLPIFDAYNVTRQIKASFGRIVNMRRGAYLVIEHTEALHVIDVNSGIRSNSGAATQEDTAFNVNCEAVDEVARQMRLRDMGGIVIIDLIDMKTAAHCQQIYERMKSKMSGDGASHCVLPLSRFGLMEITRERVRPVMHVDTLEKCPTCQGSGSIRSSLLYTDFLERKLELAKANFKTSRFKLYVHPFVYAYLRRGFPSMVTRWKLRFGLGLRVYPDQKISLLQFRLVDKDGVEADLSEITELQ